MSHSVDIQKRLLNRAVQLLSQRDYCQQELANRLELSLGEPSDKTAIEAVIAHCQQQHWLDDRQYARKFVAMRSARGYGLNRIKQELKLKGVDSELINLALQEEEIDWVTQAGKLLVKKYRLIDQSDQKQKASIYRYLASRGFLSEQINQAYQDYFSHKN